MPLDLPTVRVQLAVDTFSMKYGPLRIGQQIDVDPLDGGNWVNMGIANMIPGVTPSSPAFSVAAGSVTLTAPGPLAIGTTTEFVQASPSIQGLNVIFKNGHLTARKPGFFTITLYLMTDKSVAGLAAIRGGGQDYRSMPLQSNAGSKGHATSAAVTCIAVGNVPEGTEISVVFQNTDTAPATLIEGSLAIMGG